MEQANLKGKKILVTGGLGFIGFNAACYFAKNNKVHVIDDCSRIGVEANIERLNELDIDYSHVDIAQLKELRKVFYYFQPDVVIHMAAQVAVTLSIDNPLRDFRANLQGSFNLLELARTSHHKPAIIYASTNKVYGGKIEDVTLQNGRYVSSNENGYSEKSILSFETPYGCSKGAADQYFIDYCRTYDIPTVVFRQSCIYGPNQFGMEDQGWVAWFAICSIFDKPLTIFGDGNQVRDVLYVDDLVRLYEKAILDIDNIKGEAFNIGGGPSNTLSLNELINSLNEKTGKNLKVSFDDWRLGDQKVYISDIRKAECLLGWKPTINPDQGVTRLLEWIEKERDYVSNVREKQQALKQECDVSIVIPAKNEEACIASAFADYDLPIGRWHIVRFIGAGKGHLFVRCGFSAVKRACTRMRLSSWQRPRRSRCMVVLRRVI